ncbi:MAG: hypothetical protein JNK77_14420 [Saprospiraceae bacterium]|nr:hypothetical protein [Saprospiraceae bacterium]
MSPTLAERKLHTIELITKIDNEAMLVVIEKILSSNANEKWVQLLNNATRLDASVRPSDLTDEEIMEEVKAVRSKRYEAR